MNLLLTIYFCNSLISHLLWNNMKMIFVMKLRTDQVWGMLATSHFRVFHLSHVLSKDLQIKIYESIMLLLVLCRCETWSVTFT